MSYFPCLRPSLSEALASPFMSQPLLSQQEAAHLISQFALKSRLERTYSGLTDDLEAEPEAEEEKAEEELGELEDETLVLEDDDFNCKSRRAVTRTQ